MKKLTTHSFDAGQCRAQWKELVALISSNSTLKENQDILPFFRSRHDLSMLISGYFPDIRKADVFAHEYPIYGDFKADLIVGDSATHNYLLVEFEDGNGESIFRKKGAKATPDWSSRFEGAFSQLVDWLWKLEDMRSTNHFQVTFGDRHANFQGLIVIGKDMALDAQEASRLKWRTNKVMVDSKPIASVSYNDLSVDLDFWLGKYYGV